MTAQLIMTKQTFSRVTNALEVPHYVRDFMK